MKKIRVPGSRKKESRSYYERNKETILKKQKKYHVKNPEVSRRAGRKHLDKVRTENPALYLWRHLRTRAKQRNIDFDLEVSDIVIPKFCPVLGIELGWGNKNQHDNSYSADRLDSNKGYVKGNVNIISEKANRIKSNATAEEIRKVADWLDTIVNGH